MVFLDNASTTRQKFFAKDYTDDISFLNFNAEYAYKTRQVVNRKQEIIKNCLGLKGGEILFTRCATESAELFAEKWGLGIDCSDKEHDSVYNLRRFSSRGSVWIQQTVNQLTGEIFRIPLNIPVALDMTAGIGKVNGEIPNNCQAVWFSGHKFHAPHIGVLWLCDELMKKCGAYHEKKNQFGLLHGTIDAASIIALTQALQYSCDTVSLQEKKHIWDELLTEIMRSFYKYNIKYSLVFRGAKSHAQAINAFLLPGINADSLQQFLASKDIYIGIGDSACAAGHDFRVLTKGYGLSQKEAEQVVRISFDEDNTMADVLAFVDGVKEFKERFLG